MKYTIALGNAFDGLHLIGVFDDSESAVLYAEDNYQGDDYRIIPVLVEQHIIDSITTG